MSETDRRPATARVRVDVQIASRQPGIPARSALRRWASAALEGVAESELVIRVIDEAEACELNSRYRGRDHATNVLSFPFDAPPGLDLPLLGDLAICAPVVAREAAEQGKAADAHWAHVVIHGVLHLQGYDHVDEADALRMEALERRLLAKFGYPDPYRAPGCPGTASEAGANAEAEKNES